MQLLTGFSLGARWRWRINRYYIWPMLHDGHDHGASLQQMLIKGCLKTNRIYWDCLTKQILTVERPVEAWRKLCKNYGCYGINATWILWQHFDVAIFFFIRKIKFWQKLGLGKRSWPRWRRTRCRRWTLDPPRGWGQGAAAEKTRESSPDRRLFVV